jgi:hypothetical protein
MADPTEPKKETVRIAATPLPTTKSAETRDTARITLPTRPPANAPPPPRFGSPSVPPVAKSNGPVSNTAGAPPPLTIPSLSPKKETARIAEMPTPAPATIEMKKTQPLIDMPPVAAPAVTPVTVAPQMPSIADKVPTALCWTLIGVSAVILIIQILNYLS